MQCSNQPPPTKVKTSNLVYVVLCSPLSNGRGCGLPARLLIGESQNWSGIVFYISGLLFWQENFFLFCKRFVILHFFFKILTALACDEFGVVTMATASIWCGRVFFFFFFEMKINVFGWECVPFPSTTTKRQEPESNGTFPPLQSNQTSLFASFNFHCHWFFNEKFF